MAQGDKVALPGVTIKAALSAPHAELRVYPGLDHFDIYDGPGHDAVVTDELDFLHRHFG